MGTVRLRLAALAAVLVIAPLGLTACGLISLSDGVGSGTGGGLADDGPEKSRERVQAYLDAMKAKSLDAGRSQLCAPMQEIFDQAATGPNGDFADHFTVSAATITDVRANNGAQEVSTSITVDAPGRSGPTSLVFTVVQNGGEWCIAKEAPGGHVPTASVTG